MKKRYILLAGVLAVSLLAAGCGKDKEEAVPQVPVTATPAPEAPKTEGNLVNMQKTEDETASIKNVLGEKTATAAKFVLINKTGADVATVHIRPHTEDDDDESWGNDLVNGKFVLKDGDKAVYYYEKGAKDDDGNPIKTYDVRIDYTDEDRYECFFRKLPFSSISQLTLRMDGETELPFATYTNGGSKKEFSTLNEVKKRVGLYDEDDEDDRDYEETEDDNRDDTEDNQPQEPTPTPGDVMDPEDPDNPGTPDQDPDIEVPVEGDDPISTAADYIGRSLDELIGACGSPTGSDYQDEPETGKTGYHYYSIGDSTFTVSTTVDENGNEIVAGVW